MDAHCIVAGCARSANDSLCGPHRQVARRMNISPPALARLYASGCLICHTKVDLVVDHDHSCCPDSATSCGSCVRGALCRGCNTMVGYFDRDPVRAASAAAYAQGQPHLSPDPYFDGSRVRRGPYAPRSAHGTVRIDGKGRVSLGRHVDDPDAEFTIEGRPDGSVVLTPQIVG